MTDDREARIRVAAGWTDMGRRLQEIRDLLTEAEERGKAVFRDKYNAAVEAAEQAETVPCPDPDCLGGGKPRGGGVHYVTRDMAMDAGDPSMEGMAVEEEPVWDACETCHGTGRIRRELKGALWGVKIASPTPEAYHRHRDECIEKWGER